MCQDMLNKSAGKPEHPVKKVLATPSDSAVPIVIDDGDDVLEFTDDDMAISPEPMPRARDSDDENESIAGSQPFQAIMADQQITLAEARQATAAARNPLALSKPPAVAKYSTSTSRTPTPTGDAAKDKQSPSMRADEPLPLAKLQPLALTMPTRPFFLREVLARDPAALLKDFPLPPLRKTYDSLEQYQTTMGPRIIAEALASLDDDARSSAHNRMTVQSYAAGKPLATVVYRTTTQLGMNLTEGDVVKLEARNQTTATTVACLGMVQAIDMTEKDGQASVSIMVHGPASDLAHRLPQGLVMFRSLNSLVTSIRQYEGLMRLDTTIKVLPYVLRLTPTVPNGVFSRRSITSRYKSSILQGLTRVAGTLNAEQTDAIRYCHPVCLYA
jgi:hypothetical protein